MPVARRGILVSPDSTDWTAIEADVGVRFWADSGFARGASIAAGTGYHFKKHLLNGAWVSDVNQGQYRPTANDGLTSLDRAPITGIDNLGTCITPTLVDANGQTVVPPTTQWQPLGISGWGTVQPIAPRVYPAMPSPPSCSAGVRAGAGSALRAPAAPSRAWLTRYVVTPARAAGTRAHFDSLFGTPRRDVGRSVYAHEEHGRRTEIAVDDSTGAIAEVRQWTQGRLHSLLQRTYARDVGGLLLLRSEHIDVYRTGGPAAARAIELTYSNIALYKED